MNKQEYEIEVAKQKERQANGWLTRKEREKLKHMIDNPKEYIKDEPPKPVGKPIVTNYRELRKPCQLVTKDDNIKQIVSELRDTLIANERGIGISANQIGYNLRISLIRMPKLEKDTKKLEYNEVVLINPVIVERQQKTVFHGEGCLSLPGIHVDTDRFVFVTVSYRNEKFEEVMSFFVDLESIAVQHEIDHLHGKTIIEAKHRSV